jgi:signal transduction histidine kinase
LRARLVGILLLALFVALTSSGYATQLVLQAYLVRQVDTQLIANAGQMAHIVVEALQRQQGSVTIPFNVSVRVRSMDGAVLASVPSATGASPRWPESEHADRNDTGSAGNAEAVGDTGGEQDENDSSDTGDAESGRNGADAGDAGNGGDTEDEQLRTGGREEFGAVSGTAPRSEAETVEHEPIEVGSDSGEIRWRMVTVLVSERDRSYLADVAVSLTDVEHTTERLRIYLIVVGLAVATAVTPVGWLAIRRSFVPLHQVEETAAAIAAGDLTRRVPEHPRTTEVGRLTSSLNGMLNQIERAFRDRAASEARTRRFAADASHELRTPLASIRGFAELYRQGAVPPDEVPRTLRRIEDEATRMSGLVEDLLLLARLDEQRPGRTDPVDLTVLAGDAVHDAHGLDPTRQVRLIGVAGARGPATAMVTGDEDRLRQVVANLVGNAVRHTPAGSPIEVAVGVDARERAVIEVRDHGPGLPDGQAERVFERFYRVDASRTRSGGGGSGLGLSIVSAVVAAHGGQVAVRPTPGGGATFRVDFPVRGPDADH